ncbi:YceI family protein [Maritimibacter sp. UBA3975]|uniref:YceI family protein n=1 Tax=Maritimibacter sp. UBA3975 TaxID=1946833 RepID=UPI0025BAEC4D|nr:YceI family protein [Maritimibacter sp. UBA3975]|tara:strand:- start:9724 stop:10293 length:570 start_codon:yes stop_codon:yes gene_type:complete
MFRFLASALSFVIWSGAAQAEPVSYRLDPARSVVGYEVGFGQDLIKGRIPVRSADVTLDFRSNSNSSVSVTLNAAGATSSFPFAEQALKGPKVLATGQFPTMTFRSSAFRIGTTTAQVDGQVTIRGVTRPVRLDAQVFRQQGTDPGDLSKMSVHLTGAVNRSEFGATGWNDMVADRVVISIVARLDRAG